MTTKKPDVDIAAVCYIDCSEKSQPNNKEAIKNKKLT
jgi:hypothetical protein